MKVLLLSKYSRMGASSRLRALQYLPYLERNGVHVKVQTLFDDQYLESLYQGRGRSNWLTLKRYIARFLVLLQVAKYDVIWIEKEIFPFLPATMERLLKFFGIPYVVDYDDAIFHNYDLSKNMFVRALLSSKVDVVMRYADCVVAGNSYLAQRAVSAGASSVEVVPTVVDYLRYSGEASQRSRKLTIGWIGSPSTEKYVVQIQDALRDACVTYDARLLLMGAGAGVLNDFEGVDIELHPWSEDAETGFIQLLDVGIMPLVDGDWEKGKCGYKLIQYMACGVPVIASPVGVNIDIVEGNRCGMLATDLSDWRDCLGKLLTDDKLRSSYGRNGLHAVEQTFSLQIQAPRIRDILGRAGDSLDHA